MIKFGYTIFYVDNVEKTLNFYEKSFELKRKFITPEKDYGELITGETTLSFASKKLGNSNLSKGFIESKPENKPFGFEIGFVTDDVESTVKQSIKNGAKIIEEVKEKPWGQKVAYISDLDGFLIEICTPMNG